MRVDRLLKLMDLRPQSGSGEHRVGGGALAGVNQSLNVVANARAIIITRARLGPEQTAP
jgi:hypothetical protein